jgi:hypothetical protein
MFAGLAAFVLDEEKTTITGMASGEAEIVNFRKTISIKVQRNSLTPKK